MKIIKFIKIEAYNYLISILLKNKSILISGGSTFDGFYEYAKNNYNYLSIKKKNYFLTDERLSYNYKKFSNIFNFINKFDDEYHFKNELNLLKKNQDKFIKFFGDSIASDEKFDVCFLGFGIDGHICSLFNNSDLKFQTKINNCLLVQKKDESFMRISVSFEELLKVKEIFVISNSMFKFNLINNILANNINNCYLGKLISKYQGKLNILHIQ